MTKIDLRTVRLRLWHRQLGRLSHVARLCHLHGKHGRQARLHQCRRRLGSIVPGLRLAQVRQQHLGLHLLVLPTKVAQATSSSGPNELT